MNHKDLSVRIGENPWLLFLIPFEKRLEIETHASGDEGVAPVVDVVGIVEVGFELEIAQLVSAFDIPAAHVVADDAAYGVSVIEVGIEEGLRTIR
jgi:hypothetical protein